MTYGLPDSAIIGVAKRVARKPKTRKRVDTTLPVLTRLIEALVARAVKG